jgi:cystathionine gamma-synthase
VSPSIHPSTTYERDPAESGPAVRIYTRDQNPTYETCEALLARLERGEQALLFASGMAAATTVLEALDPGAHVIAPERMYWALRVWLEGLAEHGRIALDLLPNGDLERLRSALRPGRTRLVWIETPANPTGEITDIAATAKLAHGAGALVVADGTLATPALCQPLEWGADVVLHSATKQLNGHSDVLAGALVTRQVDATWERIRLERANRGAVLGPFEAWLLLRGMRTLYLRAAESSRNAQRVAECLSRHPAVSRVYYPGLASHPGHEVACRQMTGGFGCIVSFEVAAGEEAAHAVARAVRLFKHATSLGGVESLIEHRASAEGPATLLPGNLLRLSLGIEDGDDLVADLEGALDLAARR